MNLATIKVLLDKFLSYALPEIKLLIKSKVVSEIKRKSYECFNKIADEKIQELFKLLEKIKLTQDDSKRKAHLEGFELGLNTLNAIALKLEKSVSLLKKEIEKDE